MNFWKLYKNSDVHPSKEQPLQACADFMLIATYVSVHPISSLTGGTIWTKLCMNITHTVILNIDMSLKKTYYKSQLF